MNIIMTILTLLLHYLVMFYQKNLINVGTISEYDSNEVEQGLFFRNRAPKNYVLRKLNELYCFYI
jgi:hypothetical protein